MVKNKKTRFALITKAYQVACHGLVLDSTELTMPVRKNGKGSLYTDLNFIAKELIQVFTKKTEAKFWQEYWRLLEEEKDKDQGFEYNPVFEQEHIDFAIRNAFFGYFALFNLVPILYKKQFKKEIREDEFLTAAKKTKRLIDTLSKYHFDVFRAFIYASSKLTAGVSSNLHEMNPNYFYFDDEMYICLAPELKEKLKEEMAKLEAKGKLRVDQATVGCPALFVENEGFNLIDQCFDWSFKVLESIIKTCKV